MTAEEKMAAVAQYSAPMNIATISAGFEKGDFLVREEQGNRVYFDFFEEVRRSICITYNSIGSLIRERDEEDI